ncbi:MAG: molecular chaperone HtpG [Erysipelotrichaceae bacterium]|nr:molecular chaperone HtpG [Erysipelotrichaceae bacterium]
MAKKQFKTESKKLLDLMINSIYTNREIFLRELISNASDALDKRHYMSLTDSSYNSSDPLHVFLEINKEERTLSIEDNGIGMDKEGLETNLGTIAHSGSGDFKQQLESGNEVDIIGQFGVGFYSAFMVAKKIIVDTKQVGKPGYRWISEGQDGYQIEETDREKVGTKITLYLRDDTEDVNYSEYLDSYKVELLVKKYSDYIRYPIQMLVEKTQPKEGSEDEYETVSELKTLNSMVPLWRRNKKDITEEDYNSFYKTKFYDWENPLKTIHYSLEGNVSYKALLYIPSRIPYNFYSKDYEAGLQLYSKGVFVMDHAKDLIPDYYSFVRGLIDTDDVSLNISREILQQNTQLQTLRKSITKKIKSALVDMLIKERDKYEEFFKNFGNSLKYGIYQDYGINKDELKDLLIFPSSHEDKYVTLKEYKERMKEGQNEIFYCTGSSIEQIKRQPQIEKLLAKGYEVLYFINEIDEFSVMMMRDYDGKQFKSAQKADSSIETEEEKQKKENLQKDNQSLLNDMKEALNGKVSDVRISSRLESNPVCLVAEDNGISMEMEKYLSQLPEGDKAKANKILEINPDHEIFKVLQNAYQKDESAVKDYTNILYQQALLIEGFPVDDPVELANKICDLIKKASN